MRPSNEMAVSSYASTSRQQTAGWFTILVLTGLALCMAPSVTAQTSFEGSRAFFRGVLRAGNNVDFVGADIPLQPTFFVAGAASRVFAGGVPVPVESIAAYGFSTSVNDAKALFQIKGAILAKITYPNPTSVSSQVTLEFTIVVSNAPASMRVNAGTPSEFAVIQIRDLIAGQSFRVLTIHDFGTTDVDIEFPPGRYLFQVGMNIGAGTNSPPGTLGMAEVTTFTFQLLGVPPPNNPQPTTLLPPVGSFLALRAERVPEGLRLVGNALPDLSYVIEASNDLDSWSAIGSARAGVDGELSFVDTPGAAVVQRFYRARL